MNSISCSEKEIANLVILRRNLFSIESYIAIIRSSFNNLKIRKINNRLHILATIKSILFYTHHRIRNSDTC